MATRAVINRRDWGLGLLVSWSLMQPMQFVWAGAPTGNLLVEWRVVSASQAQTRQAGATWSTTDTRDQQQTVQRLWVLNGGRAKLYVGRSVPLTTWQMMAFVPTPTASNAGASAANSSGTANAQLLSQTGWIDLGQGMTVHPRWPGGHAPVLLDIETQSKTPADLSGMPNGYAPDGQTLRHEVSTTLSVPLGDWVVVAQSRSQQASRVQGSWSTSDLDGQDADQLEIRVTAP